MKRLGKYIRKLVSGAHMGSLEKAFLKLITDIMTVNIQMLGSVVEDRISSYVLRGLIITEQCDRERELDLKIFKKIGQPNELTCCIGHGSVFRLSGRLRYCFLFLCFP